MWRSVVLRPAFALAVVLIAAILVPVVLMPAPALAGFPRRLEYTGAGSATPEEILQQAAEKLATVGDLAAPRRASRSTGWYIQVEYGADGEPKVPPYISPQTIEVQWNEDLSGRVTTRAEVPYTSDGSSVPDDAVPAGEVVSDVRYSAGDFSVPFTTVPGNGPQDMVDALEASGAGLGESGARTIDAMTNLLGFWTLNATQMGYLLGILAAKGDLVYLGSTTDRRGRPVDGIAAVNADAKTRTTLLLSTRTGLPVAWELELLSELDGIPQGTITIYTLWKDSNE